MILKAEHRSLYKSYLWWRNRTQYSEAYMKSLVYFGQWQNRPAVLLKDVNTPLYSFTVFHVRVAQIGVQIRRTFFFGRDPFRECQQAQLLHWTGLGSARYSWGIWQLARIVPITPKKKKKLHFQPLYKSQHWGCRNRGGFPFDFHPGLHLTEQRASWLVVALMCFFIFFLCPLWYVFYPESSYFAVVVTFIRWVLLLLLISSQSVGAILK